MSSAPAGAAQACPSASRTAVYQPRWPERTVVYQVVQRHLETWLEQTRARDPDGEPLLGYIERDFRRYLTCGILAHGFARARCANCGHDFLGAFACKGRGVCSSCTTRRMAASADTRDANDGRKMSPALDQSCWMLKTPITRNSFSECSPESHDLGRSGQSGGSYCWRQLRQPQNPTHPPHIHPFRRRNLGNRPESAVVQKLLPVMGKAQRAQKG